MPRPLHPLRWYATPLTSTVQENIHKNLRTFPVCARSRRWFVLKERLLNACCVAALGEAPYPWEKEVGKFKATFSLIEGVAVQVLEELLCGCLSRDPEQRPPAHEIVNALDRCHPASLLPSSVHV